MVLGSVDIARAYRNFSLDPYDWPLTCITHEGKIYIDTAMPFGSRLSSLFMQRMACFMQRALVRLDIITIFYLDDVLVVCRNDQDPDACFSQVIHIIRRLGLPIAWEKVVSPSKCARFLGVDIDVGLREVRIPPEKIKKFLATAQETIQKRYISLRAMQSIIGHINHLSKGVVAARLFMNRLLQAIRGNQAGPIKMSRSIQKAKSGSYASFRTLMGVR